MWPGQQSCGTYLAGCLQAPVVLPLLLPAHSSKLGHLPMALSAALAFDTRRQELQCCCVLCRQLAGGLGSATSASVLKTGFGAAGSRVMPLLGAVANLVGDNPELQGALQ